MVKNCAGGVKLEELEVSLGGFHLGPLSVLAEAGAVTVIAGPNGSGKTTLLRALAGLLRHRGTVSMCGSTMDPLPGRRGLVEYVPARPQADPYARAGEVLEASGVEWGLVEELGLSDAVEGLLDRMMATLSSGQQRLVCLTRGLASPRPVLLVDEPFSNLDVANQALIVSALRRRASMGGVVIIAMHELHLLGMLASRVIVLEAGRVALEGPPNILSKHVDMLGEIYGAPLDVVGSGDLPIILPRLDAYQVPGGGSSQGEAPEGVPGFPTRSHDIEEGAPP
jgi:iron complex transport system ATP-binding protein